jgi:hypothetical protein
MRLSQPGKFAKSDPAAQHRSQITSSKIVLLIASEDRRRPVIAIIVVGTGRNAAPG